MAISKIGSKALVDCSVAATDIADNSITAAKLAGSIANAKLANSSITVNGTSVALGASGSIPAVQWQAVITADGSTTTSAVAGNGYFIDTTSNAHTINLPGSPSAGDTIAIKDYAGTFGTNNLTIGRNGNNIQGVANNSQISTNRASIILVYSDATKGWLYTVESNVADLQAATFISATGGTVTTSGDYKIHTFTGDGCFVVSQVGNPVGSTSVDYLVVAGGGGGTGGRGDGGGGAGGYRESSGAASGCYSVSPLGSGVSALSVTSTTYPVTVGAGGTAGNICIQGQPGSNSTFSTITSTGGGGGNGFTSPNPAPTTAGQPGGSGGGGGTGACGANQTSGGTGNSPPVSPPQGNPGGLGTPIGISPFNLQHGGGGGGAKDPGSAYNSSNGAGGDGQPNSITGSAITRAGGGGGGARGGTAGAGGAGGGGNGAQGANTTACAGVANTGGGGGGAGTLGDCVGFGAAGGSGIVIIRYKYQ